MNIASCIILLYDKLGYEINNLKLNKLLFYIQVYSIHILEKSAFYESIEIWRHGPVVRDVYNNYKKYIDSFIRKDDKNVILNSISIDSELYELIEKIVRYTLEIDVWDIIDKIQKMPCWNSIYRVSYINELKTKDIFKYSLKDFNLVEI